MISLRISHILDIFVCYSKSIEVEPGLFRQGGFGSFIKMGAADRRRVNGCRTSTNNNSVRTAGKPAGLSAFIYFIITADAQKIFAGR